MNSDISRDCRAISTFLLDAFSEEKGAFYEFNRFVKSHMDQLVVCFRGNDKPTSNITIYRNNHMVWKLYLTEDSKDGKPRVDISFNHARYCRNWDKKLEELGKLGFNIYDKDGGILVPKGDKGIGIITTKEDAILDSNLVEKSFNTIMDIMDEFFSIKEDSTEVKDYFKSYAKKTDCYLSKKNPKRRYIEKRWQQRLFKDFKYSNDGLFAYDLEFSQPSETDGEERGKSNEPDMLAIRYEGGEPKAIVLVEVKSTYGACAYGDSKLENHYNGMYDSSRNEAFSRSRRIEVSKILKQYKACGLYVKDGQIIPEEDNQLPLEIMFVFTSNEPIDIENEKDYKKKYNIVGDDTSAIYYILGHRNKSEKERERFYDLDSEIEEKNEIKCEYYCVGFYEYEKDKKCYQMSEVPWLPTNWN